MLFSSLPLQLKCRRLHFLICMEPQPSRRANNKNAIFSLRCKLPFHLHTEQNRTTVFHFLCGQGNSDELALSAAVRLQSVKLINQRLTATAMLLRNAYGR